MIFWRSGADRELCLQFEQLGGWLIVAFEAGCAFKLADDRVKGTIGMVGRAEVSQPGMRLMCHVFENRRGEPRFADSRFPGNEHDLTLPLLCPLPASLKELDLVFPTNQWGQ